MAESNSAGRDALLREVAELRRKLADTEARARSPERVHERNARLIVDGMYQFAALLDVQGRMVDVNLTALTEGGVRRDDVIGKPVWETPWLQVSSEVIEQVRCDVQTAASGGFVRHELEAYGARAGAEIIHVDWSLNPIRDEEGRAWIIAEGRNITEKKRVEAEVAEKTEQLRLAHERLQELDRLKTEFFANVSHELRTPLTLILGPVRRCLADQDLDAGLRDELVVVERNAGLLLQQVNNLLDLARLEAHGLQVEYVRADLAALARTMASCFEALAAERGIRYELEVPASLAAEFDADKVQRVVLNLLSNAFKFTPTEGTIRCSLESAGDEAVLVVEDSGPGIPKHLRQAVFERFRQIEGGATRKVGGTGLGLSIAREFVGLHRGTIAVDRSSLGGARFAVHLPLRSAQGTALGEAPEAFDLERGRQVVVELRSYMPAPADDSGPLRIAHDNRPLVLVVEDNPDMNRFLAGTLRARYRVARAYDGLEGLNHARRLRPDLIVTDIMMPRMSGDQMIAELRTDPEAAEIPVVVLTAKADDRQRVELLEQTVQDHLTKPFRADELLARVGGLIRERQATVRKLRALNADLERRVEERTAQVRNQSEQLRRMAAQLNTTEQRERRRLARVLHDHLQQLLAVARMRLDMMLNRVDPEAVELLGKAQQALDESLQASRNLTVELCPPALYDRGLAAALHWLGEHFREQHGLEIETHVEDDAEPADQDLQAFLFSAVLELLLNVVKHAKTGRASVSMERRGAAVAVVVADRGVGFTMDQTADFGNRDRFGLLAMRERLQVIGGKMQIESAPGAGCRVELSCPLVSVPGGKDSFSGGPFTVTGSGQPTEAGAADRPLRVMIVDDHKIVREGLAGILSDQDWIEVVAEAADGREAIENIDRARPDVVVMDVSMPRMDGVEATHWIRRERPGIRVIALSMHDKKDLAEAMLAAGAIAYLTKGGPASELIEAIRGAGRAA